MVVPLKIKQTRRSVMRKNWKPEFAKRTRLGGNERILTSQRMRELDHRRELFGIAQSKIGSFKGKKLLVLEENPVIKEYLDKNEGTHTTIYNLLLQDIEKHFKKEQFHLIFANAVFEHDAYVYAMGGKRWDPKNASHVGLREERADVLKQLSKLLTPGGFMFFTGESSRIIFTTQEIKQAGLKIREHNALTHAIQYYTMLEKPVPVIRK